MEFVTILNPAPEQNDATVSVNASTASARLRIGPFETAALVLATASGRSTYQGPQAGAGMRLIIQRDGGQVSEALSFDSRAENIIFRASTSFNFVLRKGAHADVEADIFPEGGGGATNTGTLLNLQCFALAAKT
jgi:hypothetical protein